MFEELHERSDGNIIVIDGAEGKGGGQVVREGCALSLSYTPHSWRLTVWRRSRKLPFVNRGARGPAIRVESGYATSGATRLSFMCDDTRAAIRGRLRQGGYDA